MATSTAESKYWAKIPREVVLHRMETSDCLDARLFWAIILWSWCGPHTSDYVVLKNDDGWIRTDAKGKPIPAKLVDLRELLGLSRGMAGAVSRSIARLQELGAIRFGDTILGSRGAKLLYPIQAPTSPDANPELPVPATLKVWHVGKLTITEDDLPADTVAGTHAIEWLDDLGTQWRNDLKALRTRYHKLLVHGASERGILIERSKRSLKEETPPQPSVQGGKEKPPEQPKAEEEDRSLYQQFKDEYPKERFDEAKAKPAFQALKPADQKRALLRLRDPYRQCPRWQDQDGKWIPMASNFLREGYFDNDPPPLLQSARNGPQKSPSFEDVLEYGRKQEEIMQRIREGTYEP